MWLAFGSQTWELRDGEIVVGSGADADWRIASADLMPRHFSITVHGLNASLRPTSTDNVVVVNGKQLESVPHLLNEGDAVLAGSARFLFSDEMPVVDSTEQEPIPTAYLIDDAASVAYPLAHRSMAIGRDASNAIVIRDPRASRFHAEVRREAGGYALHSMGAGGTLVNGHPIKAPRLLADGDVVEIAFTPMRFSRHEPNTALAVAESHGSVSDGVQRKRTLATVRMSAAVPEPELPNTGRRVRLVLLSILLIGLGGLVWRILAR